MALALVFAGAYVPARVSAQVAPDLGVAGDFAVLAYSTVTNTGSTVITEGDVGVYPLTSITGFPPGVVLNGTIRIADGVAQQGQTDLAAAYVDLAGQAFDSDLTGTPDMAGMTLVPGVYHFDSTASIGGGGTLTLDANGDPAAVWIFQIGSTLITSSSSTVDVVDGGSDCNVYWQVGTSATIGSSTTFVGDILAMESITMNTSATTTGRLLARTGAVTLDSNTTTPCDALLEGALSIFKFHDVDGDGAYVEGTDIPLADWEFAVVDSTETPITGSPFTTDEFGFIDLVGLTPGDYDVTETLKTGWVSSTGGITQTGTVVDGEVELLQFGNELEEGAVGIFKFHDWNDNGTYDPLGDTPLPGWEFDVEGLVGGTVAGSPFTTDASGFIVLTGLASDTYTVTETVQDDWEITTSNDQQIVVVQGVSGGMLYFGNMQLGQGILTIFKFNDVDGNGIYDPPADTFLGDWDFNIEGPDGYDESRTTDGTGLIIVTGLVPGDYTVTEIGKLGWALTTDNDQVATVSNVTDETLEFGNRQMEEEENPLTLESVGGEASTSDKVALLMPWVVLAAVVGVVVVGGRRLRGYR